MIEQDIKWIYIAIGCFLLYLIYSCCTDTTSYLCNKMLIEECMDNINTAIKNPPKMTMSIKNWHWEKQGGTNSGNKRRVKKYTHSAKAPFLFSEWLDKSPPAETL
jgi:hypothetical protein